MRRVGPYILCLGMLLPSLAGAQEATAPTLDLSRAETEVTRRVADRLYSRWLEKAHEADHRHTHRAILLRGKRRAQEHIALSPHHQVTTGSRRIITTHAPILQGEAGPTINGQPVSP